jgi:hypothetical protein
MRLEYIPIVLGTIVSLVAAFIIYDALSPESARPFRERRRRQRAELDIPGQWMVGIGTACLAAALFGGERWRWTTIAVISGTVLIILGGILNRRYLREMLLFRGAARRTGEMELPPELRPRPGEDKRLRIR